MKAVPLFFLWLLYFLFTLDARGRYMQGVSKGYHCVGQRNHLNYTDYYFDLMQKPYREYLTWKEWWSKYGYYRN